MSASPGEPSRVGPAIGTALFLLAAPGVVAGFVPWLITRYEAGDANPALQVAGWVLVGAGAVVVLEAFVRFVLEGLGTPAPVAPTQRLVVGGLYRWVRNPMYLAVGALIIGQALVLGRYVLLAYAAVFFAVVYAFVRLVEEPTLEAKYGEEYRHYRAEVPGWWPRRPSR